MNRFVAFPMILALVTISACRGGDNGEASSTPAATTTATPAPTPAATATATPAPVATATAAPAPTPTPTPAATATAAPAPTPGEIAYWRDFALWLMDADGSNAHQLVTALVVETGPAWSPDGSMLAFTGWDPQAPQPQGVLPDVWIVDVDDGDLQNVTNLSGPASALSPSWSADGTRIVFATTDWDLWTIDVEGTDPVRVTSDSTHQNSPAWSPDGSLIAYCAIPVEDNLITGREDVWVMKPDGSDRRQLTQSGRSCSPAWSADSSEIAFVTYVFPELAIDDHSDIWLMNTDGSNQRNLTNDPSRFDRSPAWSPDGATIIYDSAGPLRVREDPDLGEVMGHDPPSDIFARPADADAGLAERLTTGDQADANPEWRPAAST